MKNVLNLILIVVLSLTAFVIVNQLLWGLATDIIYFIGINITNSYDFIGCGDWCNVKWDTNLKIAAYAIYATIYVSAVVAGISFIKKHRNNDLTVEVLRGAFILGFPTLGHNYISCGEPATYNTCDSFIHLIVPLIMSINPLAIVVSGYIAYKISWFYLRQYKFEIYS